MSEFRRSSVLIEELATELEKLKLLEGIENRKVKLDEIVKQIDSSQLVKKMENMESRKAEKDVISGQPRYGAKMLLKINDLQQKFQQLREELGKLEVGINQQYEEYTQQLEAENQTEMEKMQQEKHHLQVKLQEEKEMEKQKEKAREREEVIRNQELEALALKAQQIRKEKQELAKKELEDERERILAEQRLERELDDRIEVGTIHGLNQALNIVKENASLQEYNNAVQTLKVFINNICAHPENELYRKIKQKNHFFHEAVGRFEGGSQCLISLGFNRQEGDDGDPVFYLPEPDLAEDFDKWTAWFEGLKKFKEFIEEKAKE